MEVGPEWNDDTLDGSEIRRSPVDMVKYPRGGDHLTLYPKQPEFFQCSVDMVKYRPLFARLSAPC